MEGQKPLIFISNDDGIRAKGLRHLVDCVADLGEVVVVAPDRQHSGQSSAITVDAPLFITSHPDWRGARMYSVNGTPADCVKLGFYALMKRMPDVMLSGINHGSNSGNSVIYSGTMGAVLEACMADIPAIGYSLLDYREDADFSVATPLVRELTEKVLRVGLPKGICLNVNIPKRGYRGAKVLRASRGRWVEEYRGQKTWPDGKTGYWLTGEFRDEKQGYDETDNHWLKRGYATIVPVRPDQTALDAISEVASLLGLEG